MSAENKSLHVGERVYLAHVDPCGHPWIFPLIAGDNGSRIQSDEIPATGGVKAEKMWWEQPSCFSSEHHRDALAIMAASQSYNLMHHYSPSDWYWIAMGYVAPKRVGVVVDRTLPRHNWELLRPTEPVRVSIGDFVGWYGIASEVAEGAESAPWGTGVAYEADRLEKG